MRKSIAIWRKKLKANATVIVADFNTKLACLKGILETSNSDGKVQYIKRELSELCKYKCYTRVVTKKIKKNTY